MKSAIDIKTAKGFASLLLLLGCCACVSTPPADNLPPAPENVTPEVPMNDTLKAYRLQVGDVLDLKLLSNPELNEEVTVAPDGTVSTSIAQNLKAYGHTTEDLRKALEKSYKKELKEPHIAVVLKSFAPNRVYVLGEVNTPGEFITIGPNLTMLQAIARAGGVKNTARPDTVVIIRRGAGEHPVAMAGNYEAAVSGKDPGADVRLAPYDVVYVPRSGVADVYLNYQQYVQQFMPSAFGFVYQINNPAVTTP